MPFLATLQPAALYPPKILAFALFGPEAAMKTFLDRALRAADRRLPALRAQPGDRRPRRARRRGVPRLQQQRADRPTTIRSASASLAWIPLMFWLADRVAKTQRRGPIAALALAVALQLLVGYPEFTLHTALLLGVQAIAMWTIGAWPAPPWRTLPRLALGVRARRAARRAPARALRRARRRVAAQRRRPGLGRAAAAPLLDVSALVATAREALAAVLRRPRASSGWPRCRGGAVCRPLASVVFIRLMGTHGWRLLRELPILSGIRHGLMWLVTRAVRRSRGSSRSAQTPSAGARERARATASARGRVGVLAALWCVLCVLALVLAPAAADSGGRPRGRPARDPGRCSGWTARQAARRRWEPRWSSLPRASRERHARRDRLAVAGVTLIALGQIAAYPIHAAVSPFRPFDARSAPRHAAARVGAAGRRTRLLDRRSALGLHVLRSVSRASSGSRRACLRVGSSPCSSGSASRPTGIASTGTTFGAAEGFLDALDVEFVVASWLIALRAARSDLGASAPDSQPLPRCCATASGPAAPGWPTARASRRASRRRSIACSPRASIRAAR